ncbi:unnamed protein product [Rotaria sp. Silwood2]|nr:unnamed protein product [Rotaria sp. Silwood2]CAF4149691.1 unnamed protein product [Rotaria sp. Silwood2]CAF4258422.1 unnamed protein product [Rotaria sp. Silwood2]
MTRKMFDFLYDNPCLAWTEDTLIFISSDSDQAVKEVLQYFPNSSITVPGPIMHIDHVNKKQARKQDREKNCAGLIKVLTDFYVLGECQATLLSYSGFSIWASQRRMNPNGKIFIYDDRLEDLRARMKNLYQKSRQNPISEDTTFADHQDGTVSATLVQILSQKNDRNELEMLVGSVSLTRRPSQDSYLCCSHWEQHKEQVKTALQYIYGKETEKELTQEQKKITIALC